MNKNIIFILAIHCITVSAFSQMNPPVEKALTDPKRAANAAKADVYILAKHVISDGVQSAAAVNAKVSTKKKKSCKWRISR